MAAFASELSPENFLKLISTITAVLGAITGIAAAISNLVDRLSRATHSRRTDAVLDLVKRIYELEALRRKEQIVSPQLRVSEEELQLVLPSPRAPGFLSPARVRQTGTYEFLRCNPKLSIATSLLSWLLSIYAVGLIVGVLLTNREIASIGWKPETADMFRFGWSILYLVLAVLLIAWTRRVRKAVRLARADPPGAETPKPILYTMTSTPEGLSRIQPPNSANAEEKSREVPA